MQLTQKETALMKDLCDQEMLCIDKYTKHSSMAKDPQLKNLFSGIAEVERQHLDSLNKIKQGEVPAMGGGSVTLRTSFSATYNGTESTDFACDKFLCADTLAGEKHVSALYDTCIFEFSQTQLRDVLNHIQKEEQNHGKLIYDYMSTNGMY